MPVVPTHPPIRASSISLRGCGGKAPEIKPRVGGWENRLINDLYCQFTLAWVKMWYNRMA